ncbi:MFS transporter [Lunatimonas lonarensis]|nr:MFS transporter [Lunatimonas lonarensis]
MSTITNKVPMGQKIAFGIGMLANQMFPAVLGIFMVVLVQDLGFPGWMWGILFFLPRVFDSITDPIMGFISDNTKSKWGRRRQYVFVGAILLGISFVVMWQLYRENGVEFNFLYFLFWSFVFYLGLTIFSVPYVAMGYEMSNDFHERTDIMAVAQWIGQWAWVIAPWFWVIMYDPTWFESADVATRQLAFGVGFVCMIFALVPAIFIKSESTLHENYSPLTVKAIGSSLKEILQGFKEAFTSIPFRKLCIATFLIFNAFNTIAAFSFFIVVYYLFNGDAGAAGVWPTLFGSVGALVTTFIVIPIVAKISKKMGKKRAFILSQGISVFGYILLWFLFIPGKPYMFLFALPFFSFGIGSLFTLMMSMTADVIDLDELSSGKRREGVFGAIYWWMVKFGFAIAGLLSGAILTVVGFDATLETQSEGAVLGLRAFYSGLPILGTLVAMYVMRDYDLTEERANEIRAILDARKDSVPTEATPIYLKNEAVLPFSQKTLDTDFVFPEYNEKEIKVQFGKMLHAGLHGICFSPYLEGQTIGETLSEAQIQKRMEIVAPHTQWIRSFSCTLGHEFIPKTAKANGLKTLVGAWIDRDTEQNEKEIQALIHLANQGLVDMAAVGNEVLLRNELTETELLAYLARVKEALPGIPVGYVDAYYQFKEYPALVDACDVVLVNCYPFWEGSPIDHAAAHLKDMYSLAKEVSKGKKVIITETGWPNNGTGNHQALPSLENAMRYFINIQNWSREEQVELFYFSSFDESWKVGQEGDVGQSWGIWDKNDELKYR